ncbi:MAG: DUF4091 domain-containing protein [Candidatus Latescibacterota bacterium]|nr:DUF4091 domain-containing protein [Candidatus Latescibacterota bacterium]
MACAPGTPEERLSHLSSAAGVQRLTTICRFGFLVSALCIIVAGSATPEPLVTAVLQDFEEPEALSRWKADHVRATRLIGKGGAVARFRYPAWMPGSDKWPAMRLPDETLEAHSDWRDFDTFALDLGTSHPRTIHLKIRIDDDRGAYAIRILPVAPGPLRAHRLSLASLDDELDLRRITRVDLYLSQPAADYVIDVDNLRLEADSLRAEARVLIDPLGEDSSLTVQVEHNRRALVQVVVTRELADRAVIVARSASAGRRLQLKAGKELPAGSYIVHMTSTDPAWGSEPLKRRWGPLELALPAPDLVAWFEPSTRKIRHDDHPDSAVPLYTSPSEIVVSPGGEVVLARNEGEAVQLVLRAASDRRLRVAASELTPVGFDTDSTPQLQLYWVGYVHTQRPEDYAVEASGWWPDPLLPAGEIALRRASSTPLWIKVTTDADTPPGSYHGEVYLRTDGLSELRVPLHVRVYDTTLADTTAIRTVFSLYEHMLPQVYGERMARRLRSDYHEFLSQSRLNVTSLYARSMPRLTDLRRQANRRSGLNAFVIFSLETRTYSARELDTLARELEPLVQQLRQERILDRALLYGFDEATSEFFPEMRRAFAFFKQRFPDLRTATTARDPSLGVDTGLASLVDIWIPLTAYYDPLAAVRARTRGTEVWWYICIAPTHPHANWFIEYPALEARLLWWMAHRQGVEGFAYYSVNRWANQHTPLTRINDTHLVNWNPASFGTANGDGSLIYAGPAGPVSSLRMELVRDGIEDHQLLHQLAESDSAGSVLARELADRLIATLTDFTEDPALFAQVRRELLEVLARRSAGEIDR